MFTKVVYSETRPLFFVPLCISYPTTHTLLRTPCIFMTPTRCIPLSSSLEGKTRTQIESSKAKATQREPNYETRSLRRPLHQLLQSNSMITRLSMLGHINRIVCHVTNHPSTLPIPRNPEQHLTGVDFASTCWDPDEIVFGDEIFGEGTEGDFLRMRSI